MLTPFVRVHALAPGRQAVEYFADIEAPRDHRRMIRLITFATEAERQKKLRAIDREWSC